MHKFPPQANHRSMKKHRNQKTLKLAPRSILIYEPKKNFEYSSKKQKWNGQSKDFTLTTLNVNPSFDNTAIATNGQKKKNIIEKINRIAKTLKKIFPK